MSSFTKQQIRTGNHRLLKLAAFLRTLPREKFNYERWVGSDWQGKQDLSCGTTGCALGWAATMPEFRRLGLELRLSGNLAGYVTLKDEGPPVGWGEENSKSYAAACRIFYLDAEESEDEYLFRPKVGEEDATPKYVARKIEKFVANREKALNKK